MAPRRTPGRTPAWGVGLLRKRRRARSFPRDGGRGERGSGDEALEEYAYATSSEVPVAPPANLLELWEAQELCDVELVVEEECHEPGKSPGGVVVAAHRVVLASASKFLRTLFLRDRPCARVPVHGVRAHALRAAVEALYRGSISLAPDSIQGVLQAADALDLKAVHGACAAYLQQQLRPETALATLALCDAHGLATSEVARQATALALRSFSRAIAAAGADDALDALEPERLLAMLASDELEAQEERAVLSTALAWARRNERGRARHLPALLKTVRWELLPADTITNYLVEEVSVAERFFPGALADGERRECQSVLHAALNTRMSETLGGALSLCLDALPARHCKGAARLRSASATPPASRPRLPAARGLIVVGGWSSPCALAEITAEILPARRSGTRSTRASLPLSSDDELAPPDGLSSEEESDSDSSDDDLNRDAGENDASVAERTHRVPPPRERLWSPAARGGCPRACAAAVALDGGFVAVYGGASDEHGLTSLTSAEIYDSRSKLWSALPSMSCARSRLGGACHGGRMPIAVGGYDASTGVYHHTAEALDANRWSRLPDLAESRASLGSISVGDKLYAIGGRSARGELASVEVLDLAGGGVGWKAAPPLPLERVGAAVTAYLSGGSRIFCAGGAGAGERCTNSFWAMDPREGAWTPLPPMAHCRAGAAAACTLSDVYVCGGVGPLGYISHVELFDTRAGRWRKTPGMTAPRSGACAAALL